MLELTIERPAQGGRMIARDFSAAADGGPGAIVLVSGAIPGERVRARVTERRQGVAFAETVEVLEASPDRRVPPFDPLCGGNLLAHIAYPRQLELKREMLSDAFRRQARMELSTLPPITGSPETGYRMRARLHMTRGRLGFYRERSKDVCDAARTGQLSAAVAGVIEAAQAALAPVAAVIEEIVLAENAAADMRVLHVVLSDAASPSSLEPLHLIDGVTGVTASEIKGAVTPIAGASLVTEHLPGGAAVARHAASFFQANRFLLADLVSKVVDASGTGPLADLFAGVGVFAVEAASRGRDVVAVEGDRQSGADLRSNLAPFADRARAVTQDVENWLSSVSEGGATSLASGAVIIDPPRTGLSPAMRAGLVAVHPRRIVYVSCDPVTLARDVKEFAAAGYGLTHLEALDLFPNTPHVESIAVLQA
jgi:23S rRNA (uracil1939-C5)-methyltransferase